MSLELLARTALLGSERAPAPTLDAQLTALAIADDPPRTLLRQAAWCALSERAGWTPSTSPQTMPACLPERLPAIREPTVLLLFEALAREDATLVRECLEQIVAHGLRLDERLAPRMLAQSADAQLRGLVVAAGGEMAQWLIQLNPDWAVAVASGTESGWTDGNLTQRVAFLSAERALDRTAARDRLQAVFAAEAPDARAELLAALKIGLNADDEPFLESVLGDKRKEVRRAALALLQRLPQSQLGERAWAIAQPLLAFKPGGWLRKAALELSLPEACNAAMQRDGIDAKPPATFKAGERSFWLEELLARIPPQRWCTSFGVDAATVWGLAEKHEFSEVLRRGWLRAALSFGDLAWAALALDARGLHPWGPELAGPLAAIIGAAPDGEMRVAAYLQSHVDDYSALMPMALPSPWSVPFSRTVLGWLRSRWNQCASKGQAYLLLSILRALAQRLSLDLVIDESGWSGDPDSRIPRALSEFFGTHSLRRTFLTSLKQESP